MGKHIDFGTVNKTHTNNLERDMLIETDLEGKIDNFTDFKSEALTPVFEAIVNSIQAIEERGSTEKGKIIVKIIREKTSQKPLIAEEGKTEEPKIKQFEIQDDGIGFDDNNFKSFKISDSTYKKKKGGKGIGRFSWLKAFDKIEIESIYSNNGDKTIRTFEFTKKQGVVPKQNNPVPINTIQKTTVKLIGFREKYRKQPSAYKTTKKIAQRIFEYFLSYYLEESAPSIIVIDGNEQPISLDSFYKNIQPNIQNENIVVEGQQFTIHHVKLYGTYNDMHKIVFCANNRDVKSYKLKQILGIPALLDGESEFYYAGYVSGKYLNEHVDSGRASFYIPEDIHSEYIGDDSISMSEIKNEVVKKTIGYLSIYIKALDDQKHAIVSDYVSKNPMLRAVPHYCPNIYEEIEPYSSIEKINEILYKYKGIAELEIQKNTDDLLRTQVKSFQEIEGKCKELSDKITEFQKDDLTQYILKRKLIIDLINKKLELIKTDEKYQPEAVIHDILFPRDASSDKILYENHNLWIIDENLAYHHYAKSNKAVGKTIPDIIIFEDIDENSVAKSITIIELKQPQRDRLDRSIIEQMFDVIEEIRTKKIQRENGRDINVSPSTKYNCFAICDIKEPVRRDAVAHKLIDFKNNLGYYGFNEYYNAFIEVLAYDQIVSDVIKRHQTFFEKLGIKG